jgi:preprotein translocase subunit SecE
MKAKMQNKQVESSRKLDWLLWLLIVSIFGSGLTANTFYWPDISSYIKLAIWIVLVLAMLGLALLTQKGKAALEFAKTARMELKKVFWPTRQETVQTTLLVIVVVVVVALFLWGADTFFMWAVSFLTGQRG